MKKASFCFFLISALLSSPSTHGQLPAAWMSGDNIPNQSGVYGAKGGAVTVKPGARHAAASWVDDAGNQWLMGGEGHDVNGTNSSLNDLWRYKPTTNEWTWVSGDNTVNQIGVYGTKGTASTSNKPGARSRALTWKDGSGNLWLMGGNGLPGSFSAGSGGLNDLWKYNPSTNAWTWVSGDNAVEQPPVYGTKGTGSVSNNPGARSAATGWTDLAGNLWLMGGVRTVNNTNARLNDLWKFNPSTNEWTWVSGDNTADQLGIYGTKGVASPNNKPGARFEATSWVDASGNLWLFGGNGYASAGVVYLNDLWKFNPSTTEWTWVSGDNTGNQSGVYGTIGNSSPANKPGGRSAAFTQVDPTGNVWLMGGQGYASSTGVGNLNDLWKYNHGLNQWTWVSGDNVIDQPGVYGTKGNSSPVNKPGARGYSASWMDASGNLWLMGGMSLLNFGRFNDLWKYVPGTNQWTWVSGDNVTNQSGVYGAKGGAAVKPGARYAAASWVDASGNQWLMGGEGYDVNGTNSNLNDLWKYTAATNEWTWMSGDNTVNQIGVYGTKGTASTLNKPGARSRAVTWKDASGNLWLMGGNGLSGSFNPGSGRLNDLWKYNPSTNAWTWVSGDNAVEQPAIYGTKGTGAVSNNPGARSGATGWTDLAGNLWLFGGVRTVNNTNARLNDLWKFNPSTSEWTWVSGDNTADQPGVYGSKGIASPTNKPGARFDATSWVDASGNHWLFGGNGYASAGVVYLNDLWKFNPSTTEWIWVNGDNTGNQSGVYGTIGNSSAANKPGGRLGAFTQVDPSGNVWLMGGQGYASSTGVGNLNDLWKYNHGLNQWTWVSGDNVIDQPGVYGTKGNSSPANKPGARGYSASWMDASGNLWLMGGMSLLNFGRFNDLWKLNLSGSESYVHYRDADSDGFGNPLESIQGTSPTPPSGYVTNNSDCDDSKKLYADLDGDSFGAGVPVACGVPDNTDCNDNDATVQAGAHITATAGSNGTITPNGVTAVVCGGSQTFNISPAAGYRIENVIVDGVSEGSISSRTFGGVTTNHTISVTFVPNTVVITASAGPAGTINPIGAVNVPIGSDKSFLISPEPCYKVADVLVDGTSMGALTEYTFNNVTAAHSISASFARLTYTITATSGANGTVTPAGTTTVNCGSTQAYTIAAAAGYAIQNVVIDGAPMGAVETWYFDNVTANHTISATFAQIMVSIDASASPNGTISPSGIVNVPMGSNQVFTITPASCYKVQDVLVDEVSIGAVTTYTFNNVTTPHTIVAFFSPLTYGITATSGANGTVTPTGTTTVNCGGSQSYTITPAAGYLIQDVFVDGVSAGAISSRSFTNVTANHTIAATFVQGASITAIADPFGTISPNGNVTVQPGSNQSFTITPFPCFKVADVLVDGASVGALTTYTFNNVTGSHTIRASFTRLTYSISATSGANGAVSPAGTTLVNCGASQTYTITPANGAVIQDVLVDGVSAGAITSHTFTNVTAPHTISATFIQNAHIITASAGANGTITPSGQVNVGAGGSQSFTIAPAACYKIADVLVDGVSVGAVSTYNFTNVTAPHTISASFSLLTYAINASAGANGTITPNGAIIVNCGASQAYTITPAPGYSVQQVLVDGVSEGTITSKTFTNVTAPHTISATFVQTPNTPVYRINAGGPQAPTTIGLFAADNFFTPAFTGTYTSTAPIAGTTDDVIYQSERIGTNGTLNYAFPVTNGQYTVILHFAEVFFNAANQRVFDVSVEGIKALDNFDIWKKAGLNTATTETVPIIVNDGTLNILFSSLATDEGINNPKVSAIEIIRSSGNIAPTANAGADKVVTLPAASTTLDGSGSDQDGQITGYAWTQLLGPNAAVFNSTSQSPVVSGLIEGTYLFRLVVTDNQTAVSSPDEVTVTVNRSGAGPVYRINAGGPQAPTTIGLFAADNYFTPAFTGTYTSNGPIAGTTDDVIYQSERIGTNGTLNYAFPVTNGQYTVILHFAEVFFNSANQRVFDVSVEGIKALDNFDIWKKAGLNTATTESFPIIVNDGTLNILFSSLATDGGINNPKVSAIEIIRSSGNIAPTANAGADKVVTLPTASTTLDGSGSDQDGQVTGYAWTQLLGPNAAVFNSTSQSPVVSGLIEGTYLFRLVVTDNQTAVSSPDEVTVTVNRSGAGPVYRINAGGPQAPTTIGLFAADNYFTPAFTGTYTSTAPIAGTTDDVIYQSERIGTNGTLNYAFPLTNGQYTVILHFAEVFFNAANQRVFDVSLEGVKVLDNYDIWRKVGLNTATTESFPVTVSDGTLNLYLSTLLADGGINNPKVSAIEIIRTSAVTSLDLKIDRLIAEQRTKLQTDFAATFRAKISPNPTNNYSMLHIYSDSRQPIHLRVFDANGALIETRRNVIPNIDIQIGRLYIPGLYYIEVIQNNKKLTMRLVKRKN